MVNKTHFGGWLAASWYALMWQRDAVSEFVSCYALMWQRDAVSEFALITWLCNRVMRFQSRPINWPLLTIESPVAQWLEHPTRSRRVVGSNPIWGSDFSEFSTNLIYHLKQETKQNFIYKFGLHFRLYKCKEARRSYGCISTPRVLKHTASVKVHDRA